ncbi:fructosamine kinase family protein [Salinispora vitiensis]|uniref:fructosamine kinase family protein n=1 Tax=Salinispora vitiensis TaxID=999544 RepID=UPI0004779895|nr:fructosamine kinase family protein [Salinispora vitiensis]
MSSDKVSAAETRSETVVSILDGATGWEPLSGGLAHHVRRVRLADGRPAVVKQTPASSQNPPGMFALEAAGLRALHEIGGVPTPEVYEVTEHHLVLAALAPRPDTDRYWEEAGRTIARLHSVTGSTFGWPEDGWLGLLPQHNKQTDDGHEFFATHRLLRYAAEPKVQQVLDPTDLTRLERICERLPELLPSAPAVLTHGDLWRNNLIATDQGTPVLIDPAVHWNWAEADLSMIYSVDRPPEPFFAAYEEAAAPQPGWRDRMDLLNLREQLSVLAHFGSDLPDWVRDTKAVLRKYS